MTVEIVLPLLLVVAQVSLAESSCSSCRVFNQPMEAQTEKEILIEVAKQDILKKLHLHRRPNISHALPRENLEQALQWFRIKLDKDQSAYFQEETDGVDQELDQGQSHEIISFAEIDNIQDVHPILRFQLSAEKHEEIYQGHLWLYLKATSRNKVTISVTSKRLLNDLSAEEDIIQVKAVQGGWCRVTLPMLTGKTISEGEENIYLEVTCEDCQHPLKMNNMSHFHRAFLALKLRNKQQESRTRRHITECTGDTDICCVKRFYISFKDIGWGDWIISPKGYYMNLCEGRCPVHLARAPGISASSHTAVVSLIKANNMYTNLSLCCVPTKRSSLSFLYFDMNNTIVKADIPDMIVQSCGCT
ncbi:inhibin beta B chain-like [Hyperolius riggenbachi]|uniref:inhibin beta B chain-like n=1 Tax=Hyperolius riggenbachi TaxID=752182 RepID=UPI0035A262E6